jgi:dihydroorotate dehydrogenase (fumarate)
MTDISTTINGIPLTSVVSNASGVMCTTKDQLAILANDDRIGAIFTKSCTLNRRDGNPSPRYYSVHGSSINSMGLPNEGIDYYLQAAKTLGHRKPMFISVAGLTMDENVQLMKQIDSVSHGGEDAGIAGVELNLSCPNVPGKPQIGYDFEASSELLRRVTETIGNELKFGIKLPPYFDPIHFQMMYDAISPFQNRIGWVTCINSIGNGLVIDPISETTVIAPKRGLGGIGGQAIKATALANVHSFRALLPDSIDIIGCGGITRGMDIFEHILCGATAVQIGTLLQDNSLTSIGYALTELKGIMQIKGYRKLADFRGRLRVADEQHALHAKDPAKYLVSSKSCLFHDW